jgi:acetyl/propionyl-CoA carboxylase alpha subunit
LPISDLSIPNSDKILREIISNNKAPEDAIIAAWLWDWNLRNKQRKLWHHVPSGFRIGKNPYKYQSVSFLETNSDDILTIEYLYEKQNSFRTYSPQLESHNFKAKIANKSLNVKLLKIEGEHLRCSIDDVQRSYQIIWSHEKPDLFHVYSLDGCYSFRKKSRFPENVEIKEEHNGYQAPMPGKILRVSVKEGSEVKAGDILLVMVIFFEVIAILILLN